jgi:hypothetical protein
MLTLKSLHAQPGFMEAHPRPVEVYLGAEEPHSEALEADPGSMEAHPGVMEAHPGSVEVYLGSVEPHPGALGG